jgi:hypothetical protein
MFGLYQTYPKAAFRLFLTGSLFRYDWPLSVNEGLLTSIECTGLKQRLKTQKDV